MVFHLLVPPPFILQLTLIVSKFIVPCFKCLTMAHKGSLLLNGTATKKDFYSSTKDASHNREPFTSCFLWRVLNKTFNNEFRHCDFSASRDTSSYPSGARAHVSNNNNSFMERLWGRVEFSTLHWEQTQWACSCYTGFTIEEIKVFIYFQSKVTFHVQISQPFFI